MVAAAQDRNLLGHLQDIQEESTEGVTEREEEEAEVVVLGQEATAAIAGAGAEKEEAEEAGAEVPVIPINLLNQDRLVLNQDQETRSN